MYTLKNFLRIFRRVVFDINSFLFSDEYIYIYIYMGDDRPFRSGCELSIFFPSFKYV